MTLAGTSSGGAASVSVTKNGLPRVSAWTAAASRPVPAASACTASRDSGASSIRCTGQPASAPSSRCSGMARIELVAGRQDEDRADGLDAARRVAEHVERGVVGPVDVLDDEDGRALLGQLLQQRGEDAIDRALVGQRGRQRAAAPGRRVVQRPQRARRDEVVARRHEDPRLGAQALDQRAHEARLADARLAGDQRRRAAPLRALGHRADEDLELCVALEQGLGHAHMVTDAELGSQGPQVGHRLPMCGARAAAYKMAMQTTTKRPQSSLLRRELEETLREVDAALRAMGSGDHESYAALWDDSPDVTLFGAWGPIERGTEAVRSTFEWVGSRFGDGELVPDNVVVHMSGALACTIGFERGEVSIDGGPPQPMTLRTTHVYRYTRAKWHLVHRHADVPPRDQRLQRAA